jgi:hypothetical protein
MPIVQACELATLEAEQPSGNDEAEQSAHRSELAYVEQLFEEDLFPTMRYSFIVFVHTIFETRLRGFCIGEQRARKLPIGLADLYGKSALDQAKTYLTRLVGVAVGSFNEWAHLQRFQDVRNCIVHQYGYLSANDKRHDGIRQFAAGPNGIVITSDDRIQLSCAFCEQHLTNIESFFKRLIAAADSTKRTRENLPDQN